MQQHPQARSRTFASAQYEELGDLEVGFDVEQRERHLHCRIKALVRCCEIPDQVGGVSKLYSHAKSSGEIDHICAVGKAEDSTSWSVMQAPGLHERFNAQ